MKGKAEADDVAACQDTVFGYCTAINEWERLQYILGRIEKKQFVQDRHLESVAGLTLLSHAEEHARIFERFIVPRQRAYGANPGEPLSWARDGSYYDVERQTIKSVTFASSNLAEVVTAWGFQFPGGLTMFVLKKTQGKWLIDSLKVASSSGWEVAHL